MNKLKNRSFDGELLTYEQTSQKSSLGRNTVMRLAKESGALVKIGKIACVNWKVFYDYVIDAYQLAE